MAVAEADVERENALYLYFFQCLSDWKQEFLSQYIILQKHQLLTRAEHVDDRRHVSPLMEHDPWVPLVVSASLYHPSFDLYDSSR